MCYKCDCSCKYTIENQTEAKKWSKKGITKHTNKTTRTCDHKQLHWIAIYCINVKFPQWFSWESCSTLPETGPENSNHSIHNSVHMWHPSSKSTALLIRATNTYTSPVQMEKLNVNAHMSVLDERSTLLQKVMIDTGDCYSGSGRWPARELQISYLSKENSLLCPRRPLTAAKCSNDGIPFLTPLIANDSYFCALILYFGTTVSFCILVQQWAKNNTFCGYLLQLSLASVEIISHKHHDSYVRVILHSSR